MKKILILMTVLVVMQNQQVNGKDAKDIPAEYIPKRPSVPPAPRRGGNTAQEDWRHIYKSLPLNDEANDEANKVYDAGVSKLEGYLEDQRKKHKQDHNLYYTMIIGNVTDSPIDVRFKEGKVEGKWEGIPARSYKVFHKSRAADHAMFAIRPSNANKKTCYASTDHVTGTVNDKVIMILEKNECKIYFYDALRAKDINNPKHQNQNKKTKKIKK